MMPDFPFTQLNFGIALYCTIYMSVMMCYSYQVINKTYKTCYIKLKIRLFISLFLLLIPFGIDSDFYGLMEVVHYYDLIHIKNNYGEPIYGTIVRLVNKNYLLFRIVVWGSALLLFVKTSSRMRINPNLSLAILTFLFFNLFAYARVTLAMNIYYYGLTFMLYPIRNKKRVSLFISMLLILTSPVFHTSMWFMVFMTFTIFLPIKKWIVVSFLFFLPVIGSIFSDLVMQVMGQGIGNSLVDSKLDIYSELNKDGDINSNGMIREFLGYLPFIVTIVIIIIKLLTNNIIQNDIVYKLGKLVVFVVFVSLLFLFVDLGNIIFFYRLLYMSFVPICLIMAHMYMKRIIGKKLLYFTLFCGGLNQLFLTSYAVYIS